jgi:hypothetical protein
MKKNSIFKCWICLFALVATFALVGCSNDDDNNSGDGSQSTTVLSGKTYTNADSDGEGGVYTTVLVFKTGNEVDVKIKSSYSSNFVTYSGNYSMTGTFISISFNNRTEDFTYNTAIDALIQGSKVFTRS